MSSTCTLVLIYSILLCPQILRFSRDGQQSHSREAIMDNLQGDWGVLQVWCGQALAKKQHAAHHRSTEQEQILCTESWRFFHSDKSRPSESCENSPISIESTAIAAALPAGGSATRGYEDLERILDETQH